MQLALTGWLGDVILSRSDSERQRNLMIHDQRPLPVYFSQILYTALIWSAKYFVYSPTGGYLCYFKSVHSSSQTIYLLLDIYLFEGCYFEGGYVNFLGNIRRNVN